MLIRVLLALAFCAPALAQISVVNVTLPVGLVGSSYSATFTATGGAPPYTWSVFSGAIGGLTMNTATGVFSGTPTTAAAIPITFEVRDLFGMSAQKTLTVTIANPAPLRQTVYFTPNRVRDDHTAAAGQLEYSTINQPRNSYIEVFRNGGLLRLGAEYTQICAAVCRVILRETPVTAGEHVTLFYYPQ